MNQPIETKIKNRVYGMGRGSCFTPNNFYDLGTYAAIRKSLSRLVKQGVVIRLVKGLYEYPRMHRKLGLLPPSVDKIVKAIAERDNITVQPSGAYAANLLGLSDQVPGKITYLTEGSPKKLKISKMEIIFKKTSSKNMATAGNRTGLVIQALKYLGKDNVDQKIIKKCQSRLSAVEKNSLLKDMKYVPTWMRPFIKQISENSQ